MIAPEELIELFKRNKVRFVLMGTYGINGYRDESRATQDVDLLIESKDHERAVQTIQENYPTLKMVDHAVVTRFNDPTTKKSVIDLMKPANATLSAVFENSVKVGRSHRIPDLEMALVSKFAAMVSPHRLQDKKMTDGGDFYNMVRTNSKRIKIRKLQKLAELVYPGGGKEVVNLVKDVRAGKSIRF